LIIVFIIPISVERKSTTRQAENMKATAKYMHHIYEIPTRQQPEEKNKYKEKHE
jgi:hypothetical protein